MQEQEENNDEDRNKTMYNRPNSSTILSLQLDVWKPSISTITAGVTENLLVIPLISIFLDTQSQQGQQVPGNSLNSQLLKHLGASFLMLRALIILILDVLQTINSNEGNLTPHWLIFYFNFVFLFVIGNTLCLFVGMKCSIHVTLCPTDLHGQRSW